MCQNSIPTMNMNSLCVLGALGKLCPLLKGAGVGTVIISFFLSTYYNVILAWTLFYLGSSFQVQKRQHFFEVKRLCR